LSAILEGSIELKVYTDSQQTEFPQELIPNITKSFQNLAVDSAQITYISLSASGSQAITLNGTSNLQYMYLYSDTSDLSLAINGGAAITYKAAIPGFMPLVVTSLTITNASASVATNVAIAIISG